MTKSSRLVLSAAIAAALVASPAFALTVQQAKDQCIVGEQADGYLGIVDNAQADEALRRDVRSINQQRRAFYEDLAQRNGVTVEVTAQLTAEKQINRSPAGHCIRDQNGAWRKK